MADQNHGHRYRPDQISLSTSSPRGGHLPPPPPPPVSSANTPPIPHLPSASHHIMRTPPPIHDPFYNTREVDREEGYDFEFVPPPDSKYECPICLLVLRDTLQTMCGHRFCSVCIHRWLRETGGPKCPVCNEPIAESHLFPDKFADREITSFTVCCPNHKAGCVMSMELKKLQAHLDQNCNYALVPCPNRCTAMLYKKDVDWHCGKECPKRESPCSMCREKIPTAQKEQHKEVCLEQQVTCPYCKAPVTRKLLNQHNNECDKAPAQCVFSPLGCEAQLTRSSVSSHNEENTQYHLNLIAQALNCLFQCLNIPAQFAGDTGEPSCDDYTNTTGTIFKYSLNGVVRVKTRYPLLNVDDKNFSAHTGIMLGADTANHLSRHLRQLALSSSANTATRTEKSPPISPRSHHEPAEGSCSDHFASTNTNASLAGQIRASNSRPQANIAGSQWPQDNSLQSWAVGRGYSHQARPENPHGSHHQPSYVNVPLSDPDRLKETSGMPDTSACPQTKDAAYNRQLSCEESMRLGGDASLDLMEKSRQQEASVARQKQLIFELQGKTASLESKLDHVMEAHKQALQKQEDLVSNFEGRNCNGVYIWKIRDFSKLRREAIGGQTTVLHSPGFYTSFHGYKLCVRINLNGVDSGVGTHISIFIHFMRGEFDDILEWPFRGKIILTVMDQGEHKQHITEVLESKAALAAFQRPQSNRNHKGFGYIEFAPIGLIEQPYYLLKDTLIVKAEVTEL